MGPIQLLVEATGEVAQLDGVPVRRWEGTGANGSAFDVWVHRVAARGPDGEAYLADCLSPVEPPRTIATKTVVLSRDDLKTVMASWVVDVETTAWESRSQAALARAIKAVFEDGEVGLAFAATLLMAARSSELDAEAVTALSAMLAEHDVDLSGRRSGDEDPERKTAGAVGATPAVERRSTATDAPSRGNRLA